MDIHLTPCYPTCGAASPTRCLCSLISASPGASPSEAAQSWAQGGFSPSGQQPHLLRPVSSVPTPDLLPGRNASTVTPGGGRLMPGLAAQPSLPARIPFRKGQLSGWNLRRPETGFSPTTDVSCDHITLLSLASAFFIC